MRPDPKVVIQLVLLHFKFYQWQHIEYTCASLTISRYFNLGQSKFPSHSDWIVPLSKTQELLHSKMEFRFCRKVFYILLLLQDMGVSLQALQGSYIASCYVADAMMMTAVMTMLWRLHSGCWREREALRRGGGMGGGGGGSGGGGGRRLWLSTGLRHQQLAVGVPPGNLPPPTCFTWSSPFFISVHIFLPPNT